MGRVTFGDDLDTSQPPPKIMDIQWGDLAYPYIRTDEMNKEIERFNTSTDTLNRRIQFLQKAVIERDIKIKHYETPLIKRLVKWLKKAMPKNS